MDERDRKRTHPRPAVVRHFGASFGSRDSRQCRPNGTIRDAGNVGAKVLGGNWLPGRAAPSGKGGGSRGKQNSQSAGPGGLDGRGRIVGTARSAAGFSRGPHARQRSRRGEGSRG